MRPGTIGVCSGDLTRYADFAIALMHQQTPPGTKLIWAKGVDVVSNMNLMCRGMRGDWLWMIGDDHVFDPDLLVRLLEHEVDVVVPLCLKRSPPYDPVVYSHQNERGEYVGTIDLPEHGLVEIHAAGSAGMLVRRHVLDALEEPVFETHGGLNEDLSFCAKVRDAGYRIWCDVDALLGHIGIISVWPLFRDEEWQIALHLGNGEVMPIRRFLQPTLAGAR
jgi:hypothetical protein